MNLIYSSENSNKCETQLNENQCFSKRSLKIESEKDQQKFIIEAPKNILKLDFDIKFNKKLELNLLELSILKELCSKDLIINTQNDIDVSGIIFSESDLIINAKNLYNENGGTIGALKNVKIESNNIESNGRLFSQEGDLIIKANNDIKNLFGFIFAGGIINLNCGNIIDDTAGLIISMDPIRSSIFHSKKIIVSHDYEIKTMRKIIKDFPYTKVMDIKKVCNISKHGDIIISKHGDIIISADCQLSGEIIIEGGSIQVGGNIACENNDFVTIQLSSVGKYCGTFSAYSINLYLNSLKSNKGQIITGTGGLKLKSLKNIEFQGFDYDNDIDCVIEPIEFVENHESIFITDKNGTVRLRPPMIDESEWNESQMILMNSSYLKTSKKFMISPKALQMILFLIPGREFGTWNISPIRLFPLIFENAKQLSKNQVLSKSLALEADAPSLIWNIVERMKIVKAYPLIVFPQSLKPICNDISSCGNIEFSSDKNVILNNTKIESLGNVNVHSSHFIQKGGLIYSESNIVIESPQIFHKASKITEKSSYCSMDVIKDLPLIKAKSLIEKGRAIEEAVQIDVDSFYHEGESLELKPAIFDKFVKYRDNSYDESSYYSSHNQSAIQSHLFAKEAYFKSKTKLLGTHAEIHTIYKNSSLTLESQVLENEYYTSCKKYGLFRDTSIEINDRNDELLETVLKGKKLIDLNNNKKDLKMESSILDVLEVELTSNIKQEFKYLTKYHIEKVEKSGISLPWFDDPRPALYHSVKSMMNATNCADGAVSFINTTTNVLRHVNDISHLILDGSSYIPNLLMKFASKMASFSYVTTKEQNSFYHLVLVPNLMTGNKLHVNNDITKIKGTVNFSKTDITTNEFSIEAPVEKIIQSNEVDNHSLTFSPLQSIITNPLSVLPSVSISSSSYSKSAKIVKDASLTTNESKIKVKGNMIVKGAQVKGHDLDIDVEKDLIVESIKDEIKISSNQENFNFSLGLLGSITKGAVDSNPGKGFIGVMDEINKSLFALFPSIRISDSNHVDHRVKKRAAVVADEKFKLNVGEKLIKHSADVGQIKDGKIIDDDVNASEIIEKNLHSTYIDENSTFVLPVDEIMSLFGAIHELTVIRDRFVEKQIKENNENKLKKLKEINEIIDELKDEVKKKKDEIRKGNIIDEIKGTIELIEMYLAANDLQLNDSSMDKNDPEEKSKANSDNTKESSKNNTANSKEEQNEKHKTDKTNSKEKPKVDSNNTNESTKSNTNNSNKEQKTDTVNSRKADSDDESKANINNNIEDLEERLYKYYYEISIAYNDNNKNQFVENCSNIMFQNPENFLNDDKRPKDRQWEREMFDNLVDCQRQLNELISNGNINPDIIHFCSEFIEYLYLYLYIISIRNDANELFSRVLSEKVFTGENSWNISFKNFNFTWLKSLNFIKKIGKKKFGHYQVLYQELFI